MLHVITQMLLKLLVSPFISAVRRHCIAFHAIDGD